VLRSLPEGSPYRKYGQDVQIEKECGGSGEPDREVWFRYSEDVLSFCLALLPSLANATGWKGQVVPGDSSVGGGSFSTAAVASRLVLWTAPKAALERCHRRLRGGDPALVGRMNQDGLAVDVRTLPDDEFPLVVAAFRRAWAGPEEA